MDSTSLLPNPAEFVPLRQIYSVNPSPETRLAGAATWESRCLREELPGINIDKEYQERHLQRVINDTINIKSRKAPLRTGVISPIIPHILIPMHFLSMQCSYI